MTDKKKTLSKEWFEAARSDFQYAEVGLKLDDCIKIAPELESLRDACELLTGFYIETRYPPDIPDYTKEEIIEAFENAKLAKETIESIVVKPLSEKP